MSLAQAPLLQSLERVTACARVWAEAEHEATEAAECAFETDSLHPVSVTHAVLLSPCSVVVGQRKASAGSNTDILTLMSVHLSFPSKAAAAAPDSAPVSAAATDSREQQQRRRETQEIVGTARIY